MAKKPKVLIIGGSFSGLCTARYLKNVAEVTIVEPKDYFEYTPGALHLLAGSKKYNQLLSPLSQVAKGSKHLRGLFMGMHPKMKKALIKVIAPNLINTIQPQQQQQQQQQEYVEESYDAIVICNGQTYATPIRASPKFGSSYQDRISEIETYCKKIDDAQNVVVVGGGLVGVEFAAEIAYRFKSKRKNIFLITKSDLLSTLPAKAGILASEWLLTNKVKLMINDEVVQDDGNVLVTKSGDEINYDLLIDCTGVYHGTKRNISSDWNLRNIGNDCSSIVDVFPQEYIWPYENGCLSVNENLVSYQYPTDGVFAVGDVCRYIPGTGFLCDTVDYVLGNERYLPLIRNAHLAESQAELCAHNVRAFLNISSQNNHFLRYPKDIFGTPHNPVLSCISLGPREGIIVFNNVVIGGFLLSFISGLAKLIIERSKVAEIRQQAWGRIFWSFGHVVANSLSQICFLFEKFARRRKSSKKAPA